MNKGTEQSQDWVTPPWLVAVIEKLAGGKIDLDPCCGRTRKQNPVRAPFVYSEKDDGLSKPWGLPGVRVVYVNHPYKQGDAWVEKAIGEICRFPHLSVWMLGPAFTDQPWYHRALERCASERSIKGRVRFLRPDGSPAGGPRFPSTVFGFDYPSLWLPTPRYVFREVIRRPEKTLDTAA